jgi:hypothetical protein
MSDQTKLIIKELQEAEQNALDCGLWTDESRLFGRAWMCVESQAHLIAELERDARRYRWIKEHASVIFDTQYAWEIQGIDHRLWGKGGTIHSAYPARAELDVAVDAAIAADKERGK